MKHFMIILLLILFACSTRQDKKANIDKKTITFPIEEIISKCKPAKDVMQIEKLNFKEYTKIDESWFKKYFEGLKVSETDTFKLNYGDAEIWYFIDYRKIDGYVVFSILNDNESGYYSIYHLVYDSKKDKICSVNILTSFEADGGVYSRDSLVWEKNKFTSYSIFEDEMERDSNVYEYSFKNGFFETEKLFE